MDERLRKHVPGAAAKRRAESEGIDLDTLKRDRPREYMMLSAGEALRAAPEMAQIAGSLLLAAFPDREVFRQPLVGGDRLLVFPPLLADELRRLDALLASLVERPEWRRRHAFYREVSDVRGRRRELALPVSPADYRAGSAVVGPFDDRAAAEGFAVGSVSEPHTCDPFTMNGTWFCDVFRADEA